MQDKNEQVYFVPTDGNCLGCSKPKPLVVIKAVGSDEKTETNLCGVCLTGCGDYANLSFWPTKEDPAEGF